MLDKDEYKNDRHLGIALETGKETINFFDNNISFFHDNHFNFELVINILNEIKSKKRNPQAFGFKEEPGILGMKILLVDKVKLLDKILKDLDSLIYSYRNVSFPETQKFISDLKRANEIFQEFSTKKTNIDKFIIILKQMRQLKEKYQIEMRKAA